MTNIKSKIISCGSYLPKKIMTNDDISKIVETNDEWIYARTGIKQRHIAADNEFTSDIGYRASLDALTKANLSANDIDLIIVATTTPDNIFPSTAVKIQQKLSIKTGFAFDIQAVCSGFIYALTVADKFIQSGQVKNALVIGAETMSRILDWSDRNTCVLFGDGAGAVILGANKKDDRGIIDSCLYSDGSHYDILKTSGGPSLKSDKNYITMEGKEVFKNAVNKMSQASIEILTRNNLKISDISYVVPHQANQRIISAISTKLSISQEKMISCVEKHANTSAASIPLALNKLLDNNDLKDNQYIIFSALGAGLTWGSILVKW